MSPFTTSENQNKTTSFESLIEGFDQMIEGLRETNEKASEFIREIEEEDDQGEGEQKTDE